VSFEAGLVAAGGAPLVADSSTGRATEAALPAVEPPAPPPGDAVLE